MDRLWRRVRAKKTGDTMGDLGYGHNPKGKHAKKKREINNSRTATVAVAASMGAWSRTEPTTAEATDGFGVRGDMIDRERAPKLKVEDRGQGSRT